VHHLPALVAARARWDPDAVVLVAYDRAGQVAETMTAAELDRACRAQAAVLTRVVGVGARVLVPAMPGLRFHVGFLACLYAGCVAVPVPAIRGAAVRRARAAGAARRLGRLLGVCADCRPSAVFVPGEQMTAIGALLADAELAGLIPLPAEPPEAGADAELQAPAPTVPADRLAFLQYTSGSTSAPRGVLITHGAMMANQALIRDQLGIRPDTVVVSWLPMYHDMGLCAGLLQPIVAGASVRVMEPETFLLRPQRWLEALSGCADAVTAAPDFAYALTAARVSEESARGLDLRGWRVALCGAEPVQPATLRRFAKAFAVSGFPPAALTPAYGLAEATLFVSGAAADASPTVRSFRRSALAAGRVEPGLPGDATELVSVGVPNEHAAVVVVDPVSGRQAPDGTVGELWVSGPSNGSGYWGRPDESAATFAATLPADGGDTVPGDDARAWLRTGDLGFLDREELFIAGRAKEMIIIRGVNYFPQDFERLAQSADPLLAGSLAAAFPDPVVADRVRVVVESDRSVDDARLAAAARAALTAITDELPVQTEVTMIGALQIPRTTSGKVRRGECADRLRAGDLTIRVSSSDVVG
jgi:acyl-CoA synthetase (AMP-forming)/AMP-acid ligase II